MFGKIIPRICIIIRSIMGLHREVFAKILVDSGVEIVVFLSLISLGAIWGQIRSIVIPTRALTEENYRRGGVQTVCHRYLTDSTRLRMFSRLRLVNIGAIERKPHIKV